MDMTTMTAFNIEIYNRIETMVRSNETKFYIRDGRWKPVKEFLFDTWQPHINRTTKNGKKAFSDYDWLVDLHSKTQFADYKHFLDVFEIVCRRWAVQR